jgi:hypothetical protein
MKARRGNHVGAAAETVACDRHCLEERNFGKSAWQCKRLPFLATRALHGQVGTDPKQKYGSNPDLRAAIHNDISITQFFPLQQTRN